VTQYPLRPWSTIGIFGSRSLPSASLTTRLGNSAAWTVLGWAAPAARVDCARCCSRKDFGCWPCGVIRSRMNLRSIIEPVSRIGRAVAPFPAEIGSPAWPRSIRDSGLRCRNRYRVPSGGSLRLGEFKAALLCPTSASKSFFARSPESPRLYMDTELRIVDLRRLLCRLSMVNRTRGCGLAQTYRLRSAQSLRRRTDGPASAHANSRARNHVHSRSSEIRMPAPPGNGRASFAKEQRTSARCRAGLVKR